MVRISTAAAADFSRGFASCDDGGSDDVGMGTSDAFFFQFTGNYTFDLVFQAESGEGHGFGGNGGLDFIAVRGKEAGEFVVEAGAAVAVRGEEAKVLLSEGGSCKRGWNGVEEGVLLFDPYLGHFMTAVVVVEINAFLA